MNGKSWSEKSIIGGLQKLAGRDGYITTKTINEFNDLPSEFYLRRHFGSVPKAIKLAGLSVNSHSEKQRLGWKKRKAAGSDEWYRGERWSDELLAKALRRLYRQHGYTTGPLINREPNCPSAYYYFKRFGSLDKARLRAQIPVLNQSEMTSAGRKRSREGGLVKRGKASELN